MIAQIEGKLITLNQDTALVQVDKIAYEVMLPGYCVSALSNKIGSEIIICTMEYYEGTPGGGNLIPRLVGFMSHSDKQFFQKYTSVKGMGIKKGLKSLSMPIDNIASAIESGDEKILKTLPGVGNRMAQQIIAELAGKLVEFATHVTPTGSSSQATFENYQIEALEILIAWGEKRNEAIDIVKLAVERHPDIKSAEALVPLCYRIKQGVEV